MEDFGNIPHISPHVKTITSCCNFFTQVAIVSKLKLQVLCFGGYGKSAKKIPKMKDQSATKIKKKKICVVSVYGPEYYRIPPNKW